MSKIIVNYRLDIQRGEPIENYARSFVHYLSKTHEVLSIGEGHEISDINLVDRRSDYACCIDLDCGRNTKGNFNFINSDSKVNGIRSIVWFIDSHGQSTLHKRMAGRYDHVFFAVWARRDLFSKHPSANWLPNCTDARFFDPAQIGEVEPVFDWGFYGSKGGIDRADKLKEICIKNGYTYEIREVARPYTHKWPKTGVAMTACRRLFNRSQKHDGPNQRVLESMCTGRPLITDIDAQDGMNLLFDDGVHYVGYKDNDVLEEKMKWMFDHPVECARIGAEAKQLVFSRHTMEQRVARMMEALDV